MEPYDRLSVFGPLRSRESGIFGPPSLVGDRGRIVDRDSNKKDRRRKMAGADNKMAGADNKRDQARTGGAHLSGDAPGTESAVLSPSLQAHIGRHVRAVFDEVAREPIPEHLLRLLKDLERSGDK